MNNMRLNYANKGTSWLPAMRVSWYVHSLRVITIYNRIDIERLLYYRARTIIEFDSPIIQQALRDQYQRERHDEVDREREKARVRSIDHIQQLESQVYQFYQLENTSLNRIIHLQYRI